MQRFLVRGRSIDGIVFRTKYGWSSNPDDAIPMLLSEAKKVITNQIQRNQEIDCDAMIGRLMVIPLNK